MFFDFSQLTKFSYFFDKNPGGEFLSGYFLLIFFGLAIFAGSIFKKFFAQKKYLKKSGRSQFGKFIFLGICGEIAVAARFSAVPVFSMRAILWLIFLATIFFAIATFWRIRREYKKRLASVAREKNKF